MDYIAGMKNEKEYKFLEPRPGSLYRQLWLKGKRIRAEILYYAYVHAEEGEPRTPEEIAADYGLSVEEVREAIDYCQTHLEVILADHAREDRLMEASGMNHPDYKYNPKKYYRALTPQERDRIINDEDLPG